MLPGSVLLTIEEMALRADIWSECRFYEHVKKTANRVRIRSGMESTRDYQDKIQELGGTHGCHSCRTYTAIDRDQPWVGDHVPPTGLHADLKREIRARLGLGPDQTVLMPHCHRCSILQGGVVDRRMKTLVGADAGVVQLLVGRTPIDATKYVEADSPDVKRHQGDAIQLLGVRDGCHACGTPFPAPYYHADHVFPREFCTHYMEMLFKKLSLPYPGEFYLAPQCVKCSSNQGGDLSGLSRRAQAVARGLGIVVYKYV